MKTHSLAFFILLMSVAIIIPAAAQRQATNSIVNPTVVGSTFTYEVWSRSTGDTTHLRVGFSSLSVTYNNNALVNPVLSEINPKYTLGSPTGDYDEMTDSDVLVGSTPTYTVFINGMAMDSTSGDLLATDAPIGEKLFRVTFAVVDPSQAATVSWKEDDSGIQDYNTRVRSQIFQGNISNMSLISTAPLPITLTYFTAAPRQDGSVALAWATALEINNKEFTLQRSADATHFTAIATVPGAGTSLVPLTYTYQDATPLAGTCYYRLKQQDFDGTTTYSQVVAVKSQATGQPSLTITSAQPNPFRDRTVVNFSLLADMKVSLTLIDQMGNVVQAAAINGLAGDNTYTIAGEQLMDGIYFLHFTTMSGNTTFKLIKGY